jgi:hypothetical protein
MRDMPETRFYLCDVCGHELPPNEPCHRAIEVGMPAGYIGMDYYAESPNLRADKYVCTSCLPLQRFKTRAQRAAEAARGGPLDMTLPELTRWIFTRKGR